MEFVYVVFTRIAGESYRLRFRSLLCSYNGFRALIKSVCLFLLLQLLRLFLAMPFNNNNNNKSIFKAQNLVSRDNSKRIHTDTDRQTDRQTHTHTHTHTQTQTQTHTHTHMRNDQNNSVAFS